VFMREHNRLVDQIRRQADCSLARYYYIPAYGQPNQEKTACDSLPYPFKVPADYVQQQWGQWSGDDMYRLVRMLVGVEIQSLALTFLGHFAGRTTFVPAPPGGGDPAYDYQIDKNLMFNSGLSLDTIQLFNLPTWAPDAYAQRPVRKKGTACDASLDFVANNIDYLDLFPLQMDQYIQGALDHGLAGKYGVRNSNRGNGDIMAILIRRGREMGLPSYTDIMEGVAATPSDCPWNAWNVTGDCDPHNLFTSVETLQQLYNTPGDVELAVGAALSNRHTFIDPEFFADYEFWDILQMELVTGEVQRIINLDVFGVNKCPGTDTFFARFINDDPGAKVPPGAGNGLPFFNKCFAKAVINLSKTISLGQVIQFNSGVKCVKDDSFIIGGWDDVNLGQFGLNFSPNYYSLPRDVFLSLAEQFKQVPVTQNCDVNEADIAALPDNWGGNGIPGGDFGFGFEQNCAGVADCFRPAIPFCV